MDNLDLSKMQNKQQLNIVYGGRGNAYNKPVRRQDGHIVCESIVNTYSLEFALACLSILATIEDRTCWVENGKILYYYDEPAKEPVDDYWDGM